MNAQVLSVRVDKHGVTIAANGEHQIVAWRTLRAAAAQDDAELREVYRALLDEALRLARRRRWIEVRITNATNTRTGYSAAMYDVSGEFVSGRLVAADFGQAGTYREAAQDAERAKTALEERGYEVVVRK